MFYNMCTNIKVYVGLQTQTPKSVTIHKKQTLLSQYCISVLLIMQMFQDPGTEFNTQQLIIGLFYACCSVAAFL